MRAIFLLVLSAIGFSLLSCSAMGPKPEVVYHRPDLKNKAEKVIIMPVTDFTGESAGEGVASTVTSGWSKMYGATNVVPVGPAIEKFGKTTYIEMLKTLDNVSTVEQMMKNAKIKKFISQVTGKFGNYHLAFSVVEGSQSTYDAQQPVRVHLGLFDTENLTWKWITKVQDTKGKIGDWRASYGAMVSNSFDKAKEADMADRSLASQ